MRLGVSLQGVCIPWSSAAKLAVLVQGQPRAGMEGIATYGKILPYAAALVLIARRILDVRSSDLRDDEVIEVDAGQRFAVRACARLKRYGFARLRLAPLQKELIPRMFQAAEALFNSQSATRNLHVPPSEKRRTDSRSGYVCECGREFLELHPRASGAAIQTSHESEGLHAALITSAHAAADACHKVCEAVLERLAVESSAGCTGSALASLVAAEKACATSTDGTATATTGSAFSASMMRVHRYTVDADYPPHEDLGLLTLAPRATIAGLHVQRPGTDDWVSIEELMGMDEVLLFGGSTLSVLTGIQALSHKVVRGGHDRLSAPYFLRASPTTRLPSATSRFTSVGAFVSSLNRRRAEELSNPPLAVPAPAVPPPAVASSSQEASVAVATVVAPPRLAPARVRRTFHAMDADHDGRVVLSEMLAGLTRELEHALPSSQWDQREAAMAALTQSFEALAIGDPCFDGRYVDGPRFNRLYAEALFMRFDARGRGCLNRTESQAALNFLASASSEASTGVQPDVPFACSPDLYTAEGVLQLPFSWFVTLYRNVP